MRVTMQSLRSSRPPIVQPADKLRKTLSLRDEESCTEDSTSWNSDRSSNLEISEANPSSEPPSRSQRRPQLLPQRSFKRTKSNRRLGDFLTQKDSSRRNLGKSTKSPSSSRYDDESSCLGHSIASMPVKHSQDKLGAQTSHAPKSLKHSRPMNRQASRRRVTHTENELISEYDKIMSDYGDSFKISKSLNKNRIEALHLSASRKPQPILNRGGVIATPKLSSNLSPRSKVGFTGLKSVSTPCIFAGYNDILTEYDDSARKDRYTPFSSGWE